MLFLLLLRVICYRESNKHRMVKKALCALLTIKKTSLI
ncbi:hypothetical protein PCIT_a1967 [Pseudoalteromonas citrea]|uniref:Uncharacterized protein n=1 Tax=Pseudoalteromonas citrea TaxID=43655 RepID=A0AAD4AJ37_9GAMM|nr:hypothetical protein PCIT_a1967 [Pseudoalteromonas citrea]